jgi:hypothetical protein
MEFNMNTHLSVSPQPSDAGGSRAHYIDYWQQHGEEKINEAIEALENAAKVIDGIKPVFWSSRKNEVVSNCAGETIRKLVAHLKSKPAAMLVKETWG